MQKCNLAWTVEMNYYRNWQLIIELCLYKLVVYLFTVTMTKVIVWTMAGARRQWPHSSTSYLENPMNGGGALGRL